MKRSRHVRSAHLVALLALLNGCSGGGGGSIGGGIGGTSSVLGPITGFGSVFVGGIEFDTDGATVTIDGDLASVNDLKLGMVASVRGTVGRDGRSGVAQSIVSDDFLQGPIETVDAGALTLTVLRQVVLVDASTVFDPVPLSALEPGEMVIIGGFLDAEGRVRATRIERHTVEVEIEVKGFVQDLDPTARTFRINALLVDWADALIERAPEGLSNGLFVEVDGEEPPVDGTLTALSVDVLDPELMADPGDGLKVEGFVTRIVSDTEFVVGAAQRVRVDGDTRFENGDAGDVVIDAQVDVTGVAETDGALRATEVELILE